MPMNRIQFQAGLSMPEFLQRYGTEPSCEAALEKARWPAGFRCPRCDGVTYSRVRGRTYALFQCQACRHQTSLIAGTVMQGTKLPLTTWFLAIYLISQAKTGLSALALKRHLGVSYPTAWLIHHKLMQAMADREARYVLDGQVQVDDAYLGGERSGGKVGRGSENKVPFVAAVSLSDEGHPTARQTHACLELQHGRNRPVGQDPSGSGQHRVLRWTGLLRCGERCRLCASANRRRQAQTEGLARVPVDQHRTR